MSEKILVPTLGESVTEATVSKWLKNKGDKVVSDEPLVELETDKVNIEVPSPSSGVLEKIKNDQVFFIRIEQLYPFPVKTLLKDLKRFRKNAKFYWCQEEPQNMGAWNSARNYIAWTLNHIKAENKRVHYIGRQPAASPASGYLKKHLAQQKEIIEKVLN